MTDLAREVKPVRAPHARTARVWSPAAVRLDARNS